MVLRQEWLIDAGIPHFPISRNLTWGGSAARFLDVYKRQMSAHLIGGHVNDVKWPARDHQVPLLGGVVPFERLLP